MNLSGREFASAVPYVYNAEDDVQGTLYEAEGYYSLFFLDHVSALTASYRSNIHDLKPLTQVQLDQRKANTIKALSDNPASHGRYSCRGANIHVERNLNGAILEFRGEILQGGDVIRGASYKDGRQILPERHLYDIAKPITRLFPETDELSEQSQQPKQARQAPPAAVQTVSEHQNKASKTSRLNLTVILVVAGILVALATFQSGILIRILSGLLSIFGWLARTV